MSKIRTTENGKMLKSELLTFQISARLVFKGFGLKNLWAQAELLVSTIKTQITKNRTPLRIMGIQISDIQKRPKSECFCV